VQHEPFERLAALRDDEESERRPPRDERLLDGPPTGDELLVGAEEVGPWRTGMTVAEPVRLGPLLAGPRRRRTSAAGRRFAERTATERLARRRRPGPAGSGSDRTRRRRAGSARTRAVRTRAPLRGSASITGLATSRGAAELPPPRSAAIGGRPLVATPRLPAARPRAVWTRARVRPATPILTGPPIRAAGVAVALETRL
jgi:hypothetical protein